MEQKMNNTEGWVQVKLGTICTINKHTYSQSEHWQYVNYLDTGNLSEDLVLTYQSIVNGHDKLPSRAKRKIEYNDILYSTVRPNQKHYGIMKHILPNTLVSTGFVVISVNQEVADSDFIFYYLIQDSVTQLLQAIGEQSTSAYPAIKPKDIANLTLKLPPIVVQKEIAKTLRVLDDKIQNNKKINHHLAA